MSIQPHPDMEPHIPPFFEDPKARYQGYTFYFREGFCWIDVNSTYLKARIKANGVFDVLSMSLFTMTPPSLIGTLLR